MNYEYLKLHKFLSCIFGSDHSSKALSTVELKAWILGKNILWVFSFLVTLHTCSIGLKSGEYGGSCTKITCSNISEYSGFFSVSTSLTVFLCQGALSRTSAYFFPSGAGWADKKFLIDSMVVS